MFLLRDNILRILFIIVILVIPASVAAQLYPASNQYIHNAFAINPAEAGSDDALHLSMLYRNQWVGVEGAPVTRTLAVHFPLSNNRVGLGFLLLNDSYGIYGNTTLKGNYAYKIKLGRGNLSFGLSVSITSVGENWSKIVSADTDDDQLFTDITRSIVPNFSAGILYKSEDLFLGFSVPDFLSGDFDVATKKYKIQNDFSNYNYFVYGGYRFKLMKNISFIPSLLTKYAYLNGIQFDLITQFAYIDRFWIGVGYRSNNTVIGLFQYKLNNQAFIAYSYDFLTGDYPGKVTGSHEFMLKYVFKYELRVACPR